MRELDRERAKMEQQEKKLIMDIKKMAKAGQMDAVKIMAKVQEIPFSLSNPNLSLNWYIFVSHFHFSFLCQVFCSLQLLGFHA